MPYEIERAAAVEAVTLASGLCRAVQQRLVAGTTLTKGDRSPVTVADYGAQAVVSHLLAQALPGVPLVGEEDAAALRDPANAALKDKVVAGVNAVLPELTADAALAAIDRGTYEGGASGRFWTLDPIDGTKGFLRLDQYAVALALIEDGEVVLGVLGCPNLPVDAADPDGPRGCLFVAVKGQGATMAPLDGGPERAIRVTELADPAAARFCESVEKAHSDHSDAAQIAARLGITRPPFRIDSQCKYGSVARGDASIYLRLPTRKDYVEKIWDHAAGWRVVVEAGGQVSDARGLPLNFSQGRRLEHNKGVIVTNGRLHAPVIAAVKAVLGDI
ncbi:MAG: 3'(2'),5'-bisphosphate nucleotidase [Alphaproteobacteria bacterium]|nr:3'(2'),5'-bisphosphate nucleotidase [Alphaproteobacteria bacterium]